MSTTPAPDPHAQRKAAKAYAKATRPWWKKKRFWLLGLLAAIVAVAALSSQTDTPSDPGTDTATTQSAPTNPADEPPVAPLTVTADKLIADMEANPLKASDTYKNKRVTVTGYVSNVDASGAYFSITGKADFTVTTIRVDIGDEHRDTVAGLSNGDEVTVTGTVTDVGEVMGYSIDADTVS